MCSQYNVEKAWLYNINMDIVRVSPHILSAHSFFQIKVDIPPECRIYPIESEDEEEESRAASRGGVGAKEIICPWESLTPQNGTG